MSKLECFNAYHPTYDERMVAGDWYDGQGSMLYAIASTGKLSTGTLRPAYSDGEVYSDDEWIDDLRYRLKCELTDLLTLTEMADNPSDRAIIKAWVAKL